jgi:hypothetical protein
MVAATFLFLFPISSVSAASCKTASVQQVRIHVTVSYTGSTVRTVLGAVRLLYVYRERSSEFRIQNSTSVL